MLARKYLDLYPQVTSVAITAHETKWSRLSFGGKPHPHSFVLDSNGKPTVEVSATREGSTLASGVDGFTFMKSTQSGWEDYLKDPYTTLKETDDRICATSMVASWKWSAKPQNYPATNARILATLLEVFGTTYSASVQDSLYRMGEAALDAVPEISEISMACPNMHFIPIFRKSAWRVPTCTSSRSISRRSGWITTTTFFCRPTSRTARSNARWGGGNSKTARAAHLSSLPGLTRQSIVFARLFRRLMDARVKPAHDKSFSTTQTSPAATATAGRA